MRQCTVCGETFLARDGVDQCDSCLMDAVFNVPFQFWTCPDHRRSGRVEWSGNVATCLECGRTNQPKPEAT